MVNRLSKIKENIIAKRYSLRSLCVGIIFFVALYILTNILNSSLCLVNYIFGIKCFGCGMTRAFISILKLDFLEALEYNALSIPLFFGIFIYVLLFFSDILWNKNNAEKFEAILGRKYMYVIYATLLILNVFLKNI